MATICSPLYFFVLFSGVSFMLGSPPTQPATTTTEPPTTTRTTPAPPPDPDQAASMARYVVHKADWASLATISSRSPTAGYPFVTLKSLSDGPLDNGTGVPYLYMTDMDVSGQDIKVDNRVTIMVSLAQTDYCVHKNFDPQDPRCAKVIITGYLRKVRDIDEYNFGKESLYERHPAMKDWPKNHQFYVAKIEIQEICVLDFFGGMKYVTVDQYFNVNKYNSRNSLVDRIRVILIEGNTI